LEINKGSNYKGSIARTPSPNSTTRDGKTLCRGPGDDFDTKRDAEKRSSKKKGNSYQRSDLSTKEWALQK